MPSSREKYKMRVAAYTKTTVILPVAFILLLQGSVSARVIVRVPDETQPGRKIEHALNGTILLTGTPRNPGPAYRLLDEAPTKLDCPGVRAIRTFGPNVYLLTANHSRPGPLYELGRHPFEPLPSTISEIRDVRHASDLIWLLHGVEYSQSRLPLCFIKDNLPRTVPGIQSHAVVEVQGQRDTVWVLTKDSNRKPTLYSLDTNDLQQEPQIINAPENTQWTTLARTEDGSVYALTGRLTRREIFRDELTFSSLLDNDLDINDPSLGFYRLSSGQVTVHVLSKEKSIEIANTAKDEAQYWVTRDSIWLHAGRVYDEQQLYRVQGTRSQALLTVSYEHLKVGQLGTQTAVITSNLGKESKLYLLDGDTLKDALPKSTSPAMMSVKRIGADNWVLSYPAGAFRLANNEQHLIPGTVDSFTNDIAKDGNAYFVATKEGLLKAEGLAQLTATKVPGCKDEILKIESSGKALWCQTEDNLYQIVDDELRLAHSGSVANIHNAGEAIWFNASNHADGDSKEEQPQASVFTITDGKSSLAIKGCGTLHGGQVISGQVWLFTDKGTYRVDDDITMSVDFDTPSNAAIIRPTVKYHRLGKDTNPYGVRGLDHFKIIAEFDRREFNKKLAAGDYSPAAGFIVERPVDPSILFVSVVDKWTNESTTELHVAALPTKPDSPSEPPLNQDLPREADQSSPATESSGLFWAALATAGLIVLALVKWWRTPKGQHAGEMTNSDSDKDNSMDRKAIRQLLTEDLSESDVDIIFNDYFPDVKSKLGRMQGHDMRVLALIDHAKQRHSIAKLLEAIWEINPVAFEQRLGYKHDSPKQASGTATERVVQLAATSQRELEECDILVLAASSSSVQSIKFEREVASIRRCLDGVKGDRAYHVEARLSTRADELSALLLRHRPVVVHFAGHGTSNGGIVLEDGDGRDVVVSAEELGKLFLAVKGRIECVTLNSCWSAQCADELVKIVPCVIGMSSRVDSESAIAFSLGFYEALAFGKDYPEALELARSKIGILNLPGRDAPQFLTNSFDMFDPDSATSALSSRDTRSSDSNLKNATSVSAGDSVETPLVKLWYGTNRQLNVPDLPQGGYGNTRSSELSYGTCRVRVPKSHRRKGKLGSPFLSRWIGGFDDRVRLDSLSIASVDCDAFWADIRSQLAEVGDGSNSILVFIHGFRVSFEEAAVRAAQISVDINFSGLTAFFSWPSLGLLAGYFADGQTVEATEPFLQQFLTEMVTLAGAKKIHLIVHSMGNRAVLRVLKDVVNAVQVASPATFGQIILAAPDVDTSVFQQNSGIFAKAAEQTTLYASPRDWAVWAASVVNWTDRSGYHPPISLFNGIDTVRVDRVDMDWIGHGYVGSAKDVLFDIEKAVNYGDSAATRGLVAKSSPKGDYWEVRG